jgi:hypothetical protein
MAEGSTNWDEIPESSNTERDFSLKLLGARDVPAGKENCLVSGEQLALTYEGIGGIEGTCTTAAGIENKVVVLNEYNLTIPPKTFAVKFTHENTFGDITAEPPTYPKLEVYNSDNQLLGSYPVADSRGHYAGSNCWLADDIMIFRIIMSRACIVNSDLRQININEDKTIFSFGKFLSDPDHAKESDLALKANQIFLEQMSGTLAIPLVAFDNIRGYKYLCLPVQGITIDTLSRKLVSQGGFEGDLVGNVTGNCSGSSGSCTGNAATATNATHADSADYASGAGSATNAGHADSADYASGAGSATNAGHADSADYASSAGSATYAGHATTADRVRIGAPSNPVDGDTWIE